MYSELYRKCQFFCSVYADYSIDVWREKLRDISEELSRISLLSPSVSEKSYERWKQDNPKKSYPVDKAICDLKSSGIDMIIDAIKEKLQGYKIEIFLFGSYLHSMYHNDIDIAVIIYDKFDENELNKKIDEIEQKYCVNGLDIDITLITDDDIVRNRCTQFIKNICHGKCYYKSNEVQKSIVDYENSLNNYNEMIEYFIDHAEKNKDDYRVFVSDVFYMYYHTLAAFLSFQDISWYGEKSLLKECECLSVSEEKMSELKMKRADFIDLIQHARIFLKEKNRAYLLSGDTKNIDVLIQYFNEDIERVQNIKNFCDKVQNKNTD